MADVFDPGPVKQCAGDHRLVEHLGPFGECAVRGEDHGTFLIAGADELDEQIGTVFW